MGEIFNQTPPVTELILGTRNILEYSTSEITGLPETHF